MCYEELARFGYFEAGSGTMTKSVKTPWYKFYNGIKECLDYPDISIFQLIEETSKKYPNYIALNYFGKKFNYIKLMENINACVKALKQNGINKGDTVTICMPNTPEALFCFYALNKIGAIASMIHPLSAENEIKHYLEISNSKMLITIDLALDKVANIIEQTDVSKVITLSVKYSMPLHLKLGYQLTKESKIKKPILSNKFISWQTFIKSGQRYTGETFEKQKGKDKAVILYSGGTTAIPKGIVLSNLNFNALAMQGIEACATLKPKYRLLAIMPIFHGFGLGICIHSSLYYGMTAIVLPQFSSKEFHKLLIKYKPNVIAGVPTLYEALLKNENMSNIDLSFLKCAISGGDSLSVSLKKKIDVFLKKHNSDVEVREGYGLTECVTGSCLMPVGNYRENSIGLPYPDTYYKIVEVGTQKELPYGEDGEIVLSGPTVMIEYLNNEKETNEALQVHEDGLKWLHTGDLGYMDKDGFVYFKQRLKRIIKTSGYEILPQYIENVLDSHPKVLMSTVIGIKHEYKKEVPKAFIVLKDNSEANDDVKKDIMKYCEKSLAKFSLPYEIEFRDSLPKTLVGKIDYKKLMDEGEEKENTADE